MTPEEVLAILEERGAVLRGHFQLSSGRHSDLFAQKFRVLEHPDIAAGFGAAIAKRFPGKFDLVASPAVGAVVLGFCTALAAGTRFVFAERAEGALVFRRGFHIEPSDRVLVVEDVVTTGGSAREVVDLVRATGAAVAGVGVLIDRADDARTIDFDAPMEALVRLPAPSWSVDQCPLCHEGVPLSDPGSRRL